MSNTEEVFVYDNPIVTTQSFKVSIPESDSRVRVVMKEVHKQAHNTACDVARTEVSYDVTVEPSQAVYQAAIKAVQEYVKTERSKDVD
jgi:hypothetical protein